MIGRIEYLADLATNALIQGRAQFPTGVPRECLDAVPIDPVLAPPDAAVVAAVLLPDKRAELRMTANHATRWDIFHATGAVPPADFGAPLVSDYRLPVFTSDVLPPGQHHFKALPKNSRGNGPESAVASLGVV